MANHTLGIILLAFYGSHAKRAAQYLACHAAVLRIAEVVILHVQHAPRGPRRR